MNKLFWGFIFVFLNFNIDIGAVRIGLVPTFVGYLLFYAGLSELAEESPRFEKRRPFCMAMMVYTGIFWVCDFFGLSIIVPPAVSILLSLVSSACSLYISYGIVWGIGDIEDSNRYTLLGVARLKAAWGIMIACSIFCTLCAAAQLTMIVLLGSAVALVALICFLCFFHSTKKCYFYMKEKQAREEWQRKQEEDGTPHI